ncbi:MAG: lipid-A-disaccharide synthase [Bacteroidaceae bacterium]|nr:lipid-A-disaccharide synthase [Bacteroidaceae bacterium]
MRYYLIAGEASGDLHASNLIKSLSECDKEAEFRYVGGDLMIQASATSNHDGTGLVCHYKDLAYMGFIPVLLHLHTIMRGMRLCKKDIIRWKPDVLILVDYPGFNLSIAKYVATHSYIPVYYYISPKIWAWKEYRIRDIKKYVMEMYSILPFEVEFYRKHLYPIHYVGNPCVDSVHGFLDSEAGSEPFERFCDSNALERKPIIALLAGSRRQEIKDNLRIMIEGASEFDDYQLVIAGAPGIDKSYYKRFIPGGRRVAIVSGKTYSLLHHSTAALVTSGTATLETALLGIPQVVCYYVPASPVVSLLRRLLLKVRFISLVNLIANREVVRELVAGDMNTENVRESLYDILPGSEGREQMLRDYQELSTTLGAPGASASAAKMIHDSLG